MVVGALTLTLLAAPATLVVDAGGNDANPGTAQAPLRTLERMAERLRELAQTPAQRPTTVVLRGDFYLSTPLPLGAEANGITFRADSRGATISGGVRLSDWREDTFGQKKVWSRTAPNGFQAMQLFSTGRRAARLARPRLPREGYYRIAGLPPGAKEGPWNQGQDRFTFAADEIRDFMNLKDVEAVVHHYWVTSRLPISAVDRANRLVTSAKTSVWRLTDDYTGEGAPYWLDNVGEALERPGEWYFDRASNRLLAIPLPGTSARRFSAVAPMLPTLIRIEGAQNVRFEGVRFAHTEFRYPADRSGDYQAAFSVPGACQIRGGSRVVFDGCRFEQLGGYAIEYTDKSTHGEVTRCTIRDVGAGGIKLDHGTRNSLISDCTLKDLGVLYPSAIGIWVGNSGHNRIVHNLIQRTGYTGISLGWTWGYGPSDAVANVVEGNIIRDIGQNLLSDMGGIYNLGVSPGTVLRRNYIADVRSRGYGGWGIYLDEGSSQVVVEENVVERTTTGGFHQHYGRDNVVRNNVFAFADRDGQVIRTRKEDHRSFTFERNLVVWKPGSELFGGGGKPHAGVDYGSNLFWRTDGAASLPPGTPADNRVADPQATFGPAGLSFRRGSPAPSLGIRPFTLRPLGPRPIGPRR